MSIFREVLTITCCVVGVQKSATIAGIGITMVYVSGDKFTDIVVIRIPLHVLGTRIKSSSQKANTHFLSAFIVYKTMPKVGQYLKGYWLKEFPYHLALLSK